MARNLPWFTSDETQTLNSFKGLTQKVRKMMHQSIEDTSKTTSSADRQEWQVSHEQTREKASESIQPAQKSDETTGEKASEDKQPAQKGDATTGASQEKHAPTDESTAEEKLKEELQQSNEKYLRLYAEFDNFKRRTSKQHIELLRTAGKDIIVALLPILDDFERALKSIENAQDIIAVKEGIALVQHKLRTTLAQKGLTEMASRHTTFNPGIHEAITNITAPSDDLKGKVVDELEKGYYLNNIVIRHAKVVVGS